MAEMNQKVHPKNLPRGAVLPQSDRATPLRVGATVNRDEWQCAFAPTQGFTRTFGFTDSRGLRRGEAPEADFGSLLLSLGNFQAKEPLDQGRQPSISCSCIRRAALAPTSSPGRQLPEFALRRMNAGAIA